MKKQKQIWVPIAAAVVCIAALYVLDCTLPSGHMLFTVLRKSAIYALVAVSMNLLNGFTGLFSLGQAHLDDLGHLGLLLGGAGEDDTALGLLLGLHHLDDHSVRKGFEFHNGFLLISFFLIS